MSTPVPPQTASWMTHPGLRAGIIGSLLFLLVGFVSIVWVPYAIDTVDVGAAMQDPSWAHWLGTDHLGRDMVSMLMKGILTSFVISAIAVVIGATIGVPLGLMAAAWGGAAQWVTHATTDVLRVLPALVVAIVMTTLFGASAVNVMVAVGIANIPALAQAARAGAVAAARTDYVAAARLAGLTATEVVRRHIVPAVAGALAGQAILLLAFGILAEAGLSYIGLGTQPPAASLGLILKDAQTYGLLKPTLSLIPGIAIVLIVLAVTLTGNGTRTLIDPRLNRTGADRGAA